ncbi:MAG: hypothetical protein M1825_005600 [Sarcosagium campestre]|nr:MAG: hypothetical protein M1825_005600 [Sarcosagium campestre]
MASRVNDGEVEKQQAATGQTSLSPEASLNRRSSSNRRSSAISDGPSASPGADEPKSNSPGGLYPVASHGLSGVFSTDGAGDACRDGHRDVRTLPPWVRVLEDADEADGDPTKQLLPHAQVAQHNHTPATKHRPEPGRLHDAYRDQTPVTINQPVREHASRWRQYAAVSAYPPGPNDDTERVDEEWLKENMGDLDSAWCSKQATGAQDDEGTLFSSRAVRKAWYTRFQRALLRNPIVPLVFRLVILSFSAVALALGGSVYALSERYDFPQRASTLMAIIFDSIALAYLFYITYDEYSGKPLGLRSATAKMRLILLDLFFIVFNAANLSLAFEALTDVRWTCASTGTGPGLEQSEVARSNDGICDRQRSLTSVLLVALIAWLATFSISVFRLVEQVARN